MTFNNEIALSANLEGSLILDIILDCSSDRYGAISIKLANKFLRFDVMLFTSSVISAFSTTSSTLAVKYGFS